MNNIDAKFEKISKYAEDDGVIIPIRKTAGSAGYDFYCAEDTVIPPYTGDNMWNGIATEMARDYKTAEEFENAGPISLDKVASYIKRANSKVTLVPTGIKCRMPQDYYLQLSVRSSLPLKHWLILANGVGIIDSDYYNNRDTEGHIYFQIINLLPFPVVIKKGECFGQGILLPYYTAEDDIGSDVTRSGGFGSTSSS